MKINQGCQSKNELRIEMATPHKSNANFTVSTFSISDYLRNSSKMRSM